MVLHLLEFDMASTELEREAPRRVEVALPEEIERDAFGDHQQVSSL